MQVAASTGGSGKKARALVGSCSASSTPRKAEQALLRRSLFGLDKQECYAGTLCCAASRCAAGLCLFSLHCPVMSSYLHAANERKKSSLSSAGSSPLQTVLRRKAQRSIVNIQLCMQVGWHARPMLLLAACAAAASAALVPPLPTCCRLLLPAVACIATVVGAAAPQGPWVRQERIHQQQTEPVPNDLHAQATAVQDRYRRHTQRSLLPFLYLLPTLYALAVELLQSFVYLP